MTDSTLTVQFASSDINDASQAVASLVEQLKGAEPNLVCFFCGSRYDLQALSQAVRDSFTCPVIGCTTSGEISRESGYSKDSIVAVALTSEQLFLKTYLLSDLDHFSLAQGRELLHQVNKDFPERSSPGFKKFGLLLIDGLCACEETIIGTLAATFPQIPIVGGSAGDDLSFKETFLYVDGSFVSGVALLTVFETSLPFKTFQTQHFRPTEKKLVITEANPAKRQVTEINGYPAASEYARLLGMDKSELSGADFSFNPMMLKIDGEYHVRSIQKVNSDDSLTFYCAIDKGLVLTIGIGDSIIEETRSALEEIAEKVGEPQLTLGCDCILRRLEIEADNIQEEMSDVLAIYKFIGFSTYGEQYRGVHVNQTMTGIMIGGQT